MLKQQSSESLRLWHGEKDQLMLTLFNGNVPTVILNVEQRILDWNPAFNLVFGKDTGFNLARGTAITDWYQVLDNFRRLPKRTDKLYGEGILPITDRERVTYLSGGYGRMVFTRVMSPIIARDSARIVGWVLVLNVNSVNKRQEFFEDLHHALSFDTQKKRYAAAIGPLLAKYKGWDDLLKLHVAEHANHGRILHLGALTGDLTALLTRHGARVDAVEHDVEFLRVAKDKLSTLPHVRLVRQDPKSLKGAKDETYDGVVCTFAGGTKSDLSQIIRSATRALRDGGTVTISWRLDGEVGIDLFYGELRQALGQSNGFEARKHLFTQAYEFEKSWFRLAGHEAIGMADVTALLTSAGLEIKQQRETLAGGSVAMIVAERKTIPRKIAI
jgi:protein-L-isoaspartate O-methyltransferase